jgi:hypothetical protein
MLIALVGFALGRDRPRTREDRMTSMTPQEFRQWRLAMGFTTQQQAADALDISKSAVELYETGRRRDTGQPVVIPRVVALACAALRAAMGSSASVENRLEEWHKSAHDKYLEKVLQENPSSNAETWHYQLSYGIERNEGQEIDPNELINVLRQVNDEVRDLIRTGWSMFYIFTRPEIAPVTMVDTTSGQGENDFIECSIFRDPVTGANDLWRVSRDGLATLLRNYFEDRPDTAAYIRSTPGSFLSPNWLVRDVAEFVRHARGLTERFSDATSVTFRCAWNGLEGRVLADLMSRWSPGYQFGKEASYRMSTGTWRVSDLSSKWPDIVSHLVSPVMRAANCGHVITPDWVRGQQNTPAWRSG